jgi:hypothetical protein
MTELTEQQRADQLAEALDRLFAGEAVESMVKDESLRGVVQLLAGDAIQPTTGAVARLDQQLGQWFGPESAPPPRLARIPNRLMFLSLTMAAALLLLIGFATTIAMTPRNNPTTSAPTAVSVLATITATSPIAPITPFSTGTRAAIMPSGISCGVSANGATQSADDSNELPVQLDLSGPVQAIALPTIRVDNLTVRLSAVLPWPSAVQIGAVVTIRADLCNDDTISAKTIVSDDQITSVAPTSPEATRVTPVTIVSGCDAPDQPLAAAISAAYAAPYTDVIAWRCKGFTYGIIARTYRLVSISAAQNKTIVAGEIFTRRIAGDRWSAIIAGLGVQLPSESTIITVNDTLPGVTATYTATTISTDLPTLVSATNLPVTVTLTLTPTVTGLPYVTVVVEGPVESINGVTIVIYGQRIKLRGDDPTRSKLSRGTWVKVSGIYGLDDDKMTMIITATNLTIIDAPAVIIPLPPPANGNNGNNGNDGDDGDDRNHGHHNK